MKNSVFINVCTSCLKIPELFFFNSAKHLWYRLCTKRIKILQLILTFYSNHFHKLHFLEIFWKYTVIVIQAKMYRHCKLIVSQRAKKWENIVRCKQVFYAHKAHSIRKYFTLFSYFGPLCAFLFDDGALPYMKGIIIINDSLHKFSPWIIIYNDDHNDLHIT